MVSINYSELKFEHIVIFIKEDSIFAMARENGSGKTRLFISFNNNRVYTRNGLAESWEALDDYEANNVFEIIQRAIWAGISLYKVNGYSEAIAN